MTRLLPARCDAESVDGRDGRHRRRFDGPSGVGEFVVAARRRWSGLVWSVRYRTGSRHAVEGCFSMPDHVCRICAVWEPIRHERVVGDYFPFGAEGIDFLVDVTLHSLQIKRLGRPLS